MKNWVRVWRSPTLPVDLVMPASRLYKSMLRKVHLFSGMSEQQLDKLLQSTVVKSLDRGDYLFSHGQEAIRFYLVISGQIKLLQQLPDGGEKLVELFNDGRTFAEALMFRGKPKYPLSAQAEIPSEVMGFSNEQYRCLLLEDNELSLRLLGEFSVRLKRRLHDIEILSLRNASMRVARYLISLRDSADNEQNDMIVLPVSKRMVAAHLAIQPETLSRIFHRLRDEKLVEMNGNQIHILSLEGLYKFE